MARFSVFLPCPRDRHDALSPGFHVRDAHKHTRRVAFHRSRRKPDTDTDTALPPEETPPGAPPPGAPPPEEIPPGAPPLALPPGAAPPIRRQLRWQRQELEII